MVIEVGDEIRMIGWDQWFKVVRVGRSTVVVEWRNNHYTYPLDRDWEVKDRSGPW